MPPSFQETVSDAMGATLSAATCTICQSVSQCGFQLGRKMIPTPPRRIEGYAIVSEDGMLANAAGIIRLPSSRVDI
jgi:hypothetical protein